MTYEDVMKLIDLQYALNILERQGEHPRCDFERQSIVCASGEVQYDLQADRWYINTTKEEGTER